MGTLGRKSNQVKVEYRNVGNPGAGAPGRTWPWATALSVLEAQGQGQGSPRILEEDVTGLHYSAKLDTYCDLCWRVFCGLIWWHGGLYCIAFYSKRYPAALEELGVWCATPEGWCSSLPRWPCREPSSRACWTASAGYARHPASGRSLRLGGWAGVPGSAKPCRAGP